MNDKAVHIKMPEELYDKLKKEAADKRISFASAIRVICSEHFNRQKK